MYFLFWNFSICCLVLDFLIFLIRIVIKYILCVILYSIVSEKDKNCYINVNVKVVIYFYEIMF